MIILGIDPGTATTGWGVIKKEKNLLSCLGVGIITTEAVTPIPKRLLIIFQDVKMLIKKFKPDVVAIEELFFNTNTKTALTVGQARGVVVVSAQKMGAEVVSYTPLQVKMAITGYGRASKKQMQQMVKDILKLKTIPRPDDAADALAVALTYAFSKRIY